MEHRMWGHCPVCATNGTCNHITKIITLIDVLPAARTISVTMEIRAKGLLLRYPGTKIS